MKFYNIMIDKLTDVFQKHKDSNIGKLLSVISNQLDELDYTYNRIDLWRDIDNAKGVHLDKLGVGIVQEFRRGQSDEQYRLRIKTKIIANLSKGDIETINNVLTTFLGDSFVGVKEMWSLDDPLIPKEPAGILISTETHRPFPKGVIGRVTAGGVSIYWHIILEPKDVTLKREVNSGKSERFVYSGQLYSGPVYDANTKGRVNQRNVVIKSDYAAGIYENSYIPGHSGTITDSTTGISAKSLGEIKRTEPLGDSKYRRSGKIHSGGSDNE